MDASEFSEASWVPQREFVDVGARLGGVSLPCEGLLCVVSVLLVQEDGVCEHPKVPAYCLERFAP